MIMIPYEIWEIILDNFQRQDLLNFQNVCQEWYNVAIRYVMSGRLRNRAVVCVKTDIFIIDNVWYNHDAWKIVEFIV